jgi:hypothetical protein
VTPDSPALAALDSALRERLSSERVVAKASGREVVGVPAVQKMGIASGVGVGLVDGFAADGGFAASDAGSAVAGLAAIGRVLAVVAARYGGVLFRELLRAREWSSQSMIAAEAPGWRGATKAHTAGM